MIFSDGECPNCGAPELHLNTKDLYECPNCHLVCVSVARLIAAVMPFKGSGDFKPGPLRARFDGVGFAKAKSSGVLPDMEQLFENRAALSKYMRSHDE